ncbi:MAG: hypothetical protein J6N70_11640 [Oribacterium sp.]|nr:hypothetical protein [Oribacterium sp.]
MYEFMGIEFGSLGCKVQQLCFEDGKLEIKTSDVEFWLVSRVDEGILYTPISKIDRRQNKFIVPSQVINAYHEHGRMILRKTAKGTETIPYGGILRR